MRGAKFDMGSVRVHINGVELPVDGYRVDVRPEAITLELAHDGSYRMPGPVTAAELEERARAADPPAIVVAPRLKLREGRGR